jgi:hypothetical protein
MRDDAARALRVDDDLPRHSVARYGAELRSVSSVEDDFSSFRDDFSSVEDDYAALRARATERRFERTARPRPSGAVAIAEAPRAAISPADPVRETMPSVEPVLEAIAAVAEPVRETVSLPRTAPGRSYGAHRRGDFAPSRIAGPQPGRRTIEITGQSPAPRRRSQTTSAFAARPDRAALWAFWLALFLIVMAVATAHG